MRDTTSVLSPTRVRNFLAIGMLFTGLIWCAGTARAVPRDKVHAAVPLPPDDLETQALFYQVRQALAAVGTWPKIHFAPFRLDLNQCCPTT